MLAVWNDFLVWRASTPNRRLESDAIQRCALHGAPQPERQASAINTTGEGTMKPRQLTFLLMIVLGTLAPLVAEAQAPTKVARIGWMSRGSPTDKDLNMDAFRQGMHELGYVEGRTFVMEPRYAGGKSELMP